MALTRTEQELAEAVMLDLGLIASTETPAAEDATYIKARYADALEELRDDDLVYWDSDAIPKETFLAVIELMKVVVGPAFGIPGYSAMDMDPALEACRKRIRRRVRKPSSGLPSYAEDF